MPNHFPFRAFYWLLVIAAFWSSAVHAQTAKPLGRIRHVFVVVLENKSFRETFSPDSPARYLSSVLTKQGVAFEIKLEITDIDSIELLRRGGVSRCA